MTTEAHTALINDINSAIDYAIEGGSLNGAEFGQLMDSKLVLDTERPGSPAYAEARGQAEEAMSQLDTKRRDAFTDDPALDMEYGAAACDCEAGEPCCLRAFEVEDAADGSRMVAWPVPTDGPERLYVIAKEPLGLHPSAKAKVTLTDKEACKLNGGNKPAAAPKDHAAGPDSIPDSDEITVTSPFQMPAFSSAMLPREVMAAIYLCGMFLQAKAYREHEPAFVNPDQCMTPGATGIEVFALPHVKLAASAAGSVSLNLTTSAMPSFGAGLAAEVEGEIGNQSVNYKSSTSVTSREQSREAQGPVNHPLLDFLDKIQESMLSISDKGKINPVPRTVPRPKSMIGLEFKLAVEVAMPNLALAAKSGSPNLELTVDPFRFSLNPSVEGTLDLAGLLLTRIPNGNRIRAALARPGNPLRATAILDITIGGGGTGSFAVNEAATIEVGDVDQLEIDLAGISTTFTASCHLNGKVKAEASIELETWIFTAYAAAGAEVSTGWEFGGRVTSNPDGAQKWERMHHFQGLILRGYARAGARRKEKTSTEEVLAASPDGVETVARTTESFAASTNLGEPDFIAHLIEPDGGPDKWYET